MYGIYFYGSNPPVVQEKPLVTSNTEQEAVRYCEFLSFLFDSPVFVATRPSIKLAIACYKNGKKLEPGEY